MNPFSHTLLVGTVFLLTLKELTEACSCISFHPQAIFCRESVVIRAKVISERFVKPKSHGFPVGQIIYGIQLIEAFKGVDKKNKIDSASTFSQSASCGVRLDVDNQEEYLLSGSLYENKLSIDLCGLAIPWNRVTDFQIRGIKGFYQMGCACKITECHRELCDTGALDECIFYRDESQNLACIQRKDGSCMWYPTSPSYGNRP